MGEIGASSRVIDEGRGDFGGKIEEQPPHPEKRAQEQHGKPARRVHRRGRHVSRTNNSPLANRASWLPPSQSTSTPSADLHALLRKENVSEFSLTASRKNLPSSREKRQKQSPDMIISQEIRGFVCATAHSDGCTAQFQGRIDYAKSKLSPRNAPKRVQGILLCRLVVSFVCLLLCEIRLPAQVWNGTSGVNWTTGANWAGGLVPTSTATATFNAPIPFSPTINASVAIGRLLFTGTAKAL
jgi:NAD(P)H binding domain of trans-2-enoyl-CoA reductase